MIYEPSEAAFEASVTLISYGERLYLSGQLDRALTTLRDALRLHRNVYGEMLYRRVMTELASSKTLPGAILDGLVTHETTVTVTA